LGAAANDAEDLHRGVDTGASFRGHDADLHRLDE
jgi:hypothetical protein